MCRPVLICSLARSRAGPAAARLAVVLALVVAGAAASSPRPAVAGPPAEAAQAAEVAEPFDFNGDGFADLATGVPGESIGRVANAGAVQVIYGSTKGLTSAGAQLLWPGRAGVEGAPSRDESFGSAVTSADLDRDGFADLAVLSRTRIVLLYGSAAGLAARSQVITPPTSGERHILDAMTVGDFDGDQWTDLAVSAGLSNLVMVFRGRGPSAPPTLQSTFSKAPPGKTEEEQVGNSLAAGDVTGDGRDDLVVGTGSPSEMDSYVPGFFFVPGSSSGLDPTKRRFITRGTPGLAEKGVRVGDSFGNVLVIADFDGDGFGDVAVGDSEGSDQASSCGGVAPCAGAVFVLPGTAAGPTTRGRQHWALSEQGSYGGWDYEVSNNFGASLAAGDLNEDGHIDLAVAAPFDFTDKGILGPGSVYVLYGTEGGLGLAGRQVWSQRTPGVKGIGKGWRPSRPPEGFGAGGLQILQCGNGSSWDLLIHTGGDRSRRGSVNALYGSASRITARGNQLWHQDMPGIPGRGEREDRLGRISAAYFS